MDGRGSAKCATATNEYATVRVRNGITAAAMPATLTSRSARPSRRVGPGLSRSQVRPPRARLAASGRVGLGDRERREDDREDAEQDDEVDREERERPAERRARVETHRQCAEDGDRRPGRAELETAPPVQPQSVASVRDDDVSRAHERHRAVHERGRERAGEHGEHERRVHGDGRKPDGDEHDAERGVDRHEPPRVVVEVAAGEPQCGADPHPFTPADTTPEMK